MEFFSANDLRIGLNQGKEVRMVGEENEGTAFPVPP
jgi:hypothetical protein